MLIFNKNAPEMKSQTKWNLCRAMAQAGYKKRSSNCVFGIH